MHRTIIFALGMFVFVSTVTATESDEAKPSLFERYTTSAQELGTRALSLLGIHYRYGGNSPDTGFDCSGFVRHVVGDVLGLRLPRSARDISQVGAPVTKDELQPGDLVFFNTLRRTFSHVGIYLGDHRFVHAPARGGEVRVDDMRQRYWLSRFNGARRIAE